MQQRVFVDSKALQLGYGAQIRNDGMMIQKISLSSDAHTQTRRGAQAHKRRGAEVNVGRRIQNMRLVRWRTVTTLAISFRHKTNFHSSFHPFFSKVDTQYTNFDSTLLYSQWTWCCISWGDRYGSAKDEAIRLVLLEDRSLKGLRPL